MQSSYAKPHAMVVDWICVCERMEFFLFLSLFLSFYRHTLNGYDDNIGINVKIHMYITSKLLPISNQTKTVEVWHEKWLAACLAQLCITWDEANVKRYVITSLRTSAYTINKRKQVLNVVRSRWARWKHSSVKMVVGDILVFSVYFLFLPVSIECVRVQSIKWNRMTFVETNISETEFKTFCVCFYWLQFGSSSESACHSI